MTAPMDDARRRRVMAAFRMPQAQTMVSRKSSITNAFVSSLIPSIKPSAEEVEEALTILGMTYDRTSCSYCGNPTSEWDHLRPLVVGRRPTGYISEIANLVPACGKCNQSKGNKSWRTWMLGLKGHSPSAKGILDVPERMVRLEAFERWRQPTKVDFEALVGEDELARYWGLCDAVNEEMRQAQLVGDAIRAKVAASLPGTR